MHDVDSFTRSKYPEVKGVSLTHSHSITGPLYADDFAMFGSSQVQLNLLLKALIEYDSRYHLVINTNKSKVIVFRKGVPFARGTLFYLGIEELELVSKC